MSYQPPQYQPPQPGPRRPRRTLRRVVLALAAAVAVIIVIAVIGAVLSKPKPPAAAGSPASPAATTAPAAKAARPRVLLRLDGSGIKNSRPFNVGAGPVTIKYSFNCASFGSAGNFAAELDYGNQGSLSGDSQPIANALARRGGQSTTIYPQDPGKDYYLAVDSECSWRIRVTS